LIDPSGSSAFEYDRRGLLTRESKTIGGATYLTGYSHDKSGNVTEIRFPTDNLSVRQGKVIYEYDPLDRVTRVSTETNGTPRTIASEFEYKPFGPRSEMMFESGLVDARTFDSRYRLSTWTLGSLLNYTHAYDLDSNLLTRTDNIVSANSRTYVYDELHRLTRAIGPWCVGAGCPDPTYTYDFNGNRQSKSETGTSTGYTYIPNTNKLASTTGGDVASYLYQSFTPGDPTFDGSHSYQYTYLRQLGTVDSGETATYKYDGDGRRAVKSVPGETTYYFYDPSGHLLTELSPGAGATVGKDYAYLDGAPVARVDWFVIEQDMGDVLRAYKSVSNVHLDWTGYSPTNGKYVVRRKEVVDPDDKSFDGAATIATLAGTDKFYDDPVVGNGYRYDYSVFKDVGSDTLFFYHTDHLGTPIAMTSASSGLVWKAEYRPFGEADIWVGSTRSNNLRFPGQYFDQETGLHQNWFRDYDPKTGRYREADPIGLDGGLNPYAYVDNGPTSGIDPYGLWNLWNPGSWGQANAVSWSWKDSLVPWHESSGYTQEGFAEDTNHALEAFADGVIPIWDPFAASGAYDSCDAGLKWSKDIGEWTRDIELSIIGARAARVRGPEMGRWKEAGKFTSRQPHFHLDWGNGLGRHHLPQQTGNFLRNLRAVVGRWWSN
jgi:RHS repeat-associated protein